MRLLIAAALIAATAHVHAFDYKIIDRRDGKRVATFTSDRTPGQMSRALALTRYQAVPIGNISRHYGPWHGSIGRGSRIPQRSLPQPKVQQKR